MSDSESVSSVSSISSSELKQRKREKKEKKMLEKKEKKLSEKKERKISEKKEKEAEKKEKEAEKKEKETEKKEKETEKPKTKYDVQTDVESDGNDNACVKMSTHFIEILQKTIHDGDEEVFFDTLKKTPLAVNLHYMHFLFYTAREDKEITKILLKYNARYNIVSKYFLKAIRKEKTTEDAMSMLVDVTTEISERVPLDEIKNIRYFNPEFIVMVTIESGNMPVYKRIVEEWELHDEFEQNLDLIASFFGIKKFFSDPSNYNDRRELLISSICGGSTKLVARIMRKTDSKYMTEYTLRKVRAICIPNKEMIEFLDRRYGLKFV